MRSFAILSLAGAAAAAIQGFNYGSSKSDGSAMMESDFESQFNRAASLQGTSGWTSARLYTMIQYGTTDTPISAIQAAMNTKTSLLLGLWASQDQAGFNNELAALNSALQQYGSAFTSLISGISVGSEDLYRETPTGIANKAGVGQSPDVLSSYIQQVRTVLSNNKVNAKVGHVDTWTAWVNGSNVEVINNCDFLGMDSYPYFQTVDANGIENGESLFFKSYDATVGVAQGKDVWVTESGWPVSGPVSGQAVASVANAQTYWKAVACKLLSMSVNTYWYTLYDQDSSPSFGIVGPNLDSAPLYDLSCSGVATSTAATSAAKSTAAAATMPASSGAQSAAKPITTPNVEAAPSVAGVQNGANGGVIQSHEGADGVMTMYTTTVVTVSDCSATAAPQPPAQQSSPANGGSGSGSSSGSSSGSGSSGSGSSSGACPASLSGAYQYPHLIVPVDSSNANKAYGTQYNGTLSSTESTIFNFDIPASYSGKQCSLYFMLPEKKDLQTSDYTWNGQGGISVSSCDKVATQSTTYSNVGSTKPLKSISSIAPGNNYLISTGPCSAGAYSYEFSSTGGLSLNWFNDYNPSPLGVFITSC